MPSKRIAREGWKGYEDRPDRRAVGALRSSSCSAARLTPSARTRSAARSKRAIAGDAVIDTGPGVVNVAMIHQIAPCVVTQVPGNVYVDAVELKDGNTDARTWRLLAIAMCANVS